MKIIASFLGLFAMFYISFAFGSFFTEITDSYSQTLSIAIGNVIENEIIQIVICNGLLPGVFIVISFLPSIFMIFCITDGFCRLKIFEPLRKKFSKHLATYGLPENSLTPIVSGLGCTIPAYISTRIIKNPKEKFLTMIAISFVPCRAKMTMFIILCGVFFNKTTAPIVLFSIYVIGISIGMLAMKMSSKISFISNGIEKSCKGCKFGDCSVTSDNVILNTIKACFSFLKETMTSLIIVSVVFGFLSHFPLVNKQEFMNKCIISKTKEMCLSEHTKTQLEGSVVATISKKLLFLTKPIGFNWQLNAALILGTSGKEASVSALSIMYLENQESGKFSNLTKSISKASAISFICFMIFYIPCVSAVATLFNESKNWKFSLILSLSMIVLAYCFSFVVYNVCLLLKLI